MPIRIEWLQRFQRCGISVAFMHRGQHLEIVMTCMIAGKKELLTECISIAVIKDAKCAEDVECTRCLIDGTLISMFDTFMTRRAEAN